MLSDVKTYANYLARKEYLNQREVDYSVAENENITAALDAGIRFPDYITIKSTIGELKADKDENGKAISGSKKEKVLATINSFDLSKEQKDFLYYAQNYSESGIDEAPWH